VVNAGLQLQPVGIPGELLIGGAGVTQGYLGRADRTAERFVPFDGQRVYRTGDRVRLLEDGRIEFLGRTDDQVKIRGYRVELGEIERTVREHPGVEQCVVLLHTHESGESHLVAYVVATPSGYAVSHSDRPTVENVSAFASARLPEYMVPSAIMLIPGIPLTANGKVARAALPKPETGTQAGSSYVAPRNDTEIKLAQIWKEVLKKEQVGSTDNFLALGGHSLFAIRVLGKISKTFGVRLPLRTLFEAPTVAGLAEIIELEAKLAALENMSEEDAARLLASMDTTGSPGGGS
jgi:acyl carrier protein